VATLDTCAAAVVSKSALSLACPSHAAAVAALMPRMGSFSVHFET